MKIDPVNAIPDTGLLTRCLCRRHWKLLLRSRTSNETASHPNDTQSTSQLWIVQKNGDLCDDILECCLLAVRFAKLYDLFRIASSQGNHGGDGQVSF